MNWGMSSYGPYLPKTVYGRYGFDSPVGTTVERSGTTVWPGAWMDSNPFLNQYAIGYHTGADLNLNKPTWDLDRGMSVHAASLGVVTYASVIRNSSWQGLIVIEHELHDGSRVYTRYGHVEKIEVEPGDKVRRGDQIAVIGKSGGSGGNYHLHFDVSLSDVLFLKPTHWPGFTYGEVVKNYTDPLQFILTHRPWTRIPEDK